MHISPNFPMHFALLNFMNFILVISISNVNAMYKNDEDDALVAFVKGRAEFDQFCAEHGVTNQQSQEILTQMFGTHLGILYYMRQNWNCAEMNTTQIVLDDPRECDQFREFVNIFYEYLYNVHAGIVSVRPTFNDQMRYWRLIQICKALFTNWKIYFHPELLKIDEHKVQFDARFLDQTTQINWDQFAANDKSAQKFDQLMEKMLKKVEERRIELHNGGGTSSSASSSSSMSENAALFLNNILEITPIYSMFYVKRDEVFLAMVEKDDLSTLDKSEPNYNEKRRLVMFYLMRKHWYCANATIDKDSLNICERFRHYMDLLYEYLSRMRYGFAAGKARPIFQLHDEIVSLFKTIEIFARIGKSCFDKQHEDITRAVCLYVFDGDTWHIYLHLKLVNEMEIDYLKKKDTLLFQSAVVDILHMPINGRVTSVKNINAIRQQQFDQKLEALAENEPFSWTELNLRDI